MQGKPIIIKLFDSSDSFEQRIWMILIDVAKWKSTISYRELLTKTSMPNKTMDDLFKALVIIGNKENKCDRPWINSLVVNKEGKPGPGFFIWCRKLIAKENWKDLEHSVYDLVKEYCYEFWSDNSNYDNLNNSKIYN